MAEAKHTVRSTRWALCISRALLQVGDVVLTDCLLAPMQKPSSRGHTASSKCYIQYSTQYVERPAPESSSDWPRCLCIHSGKPAFRIAGAPQHAISLQGSVNVAGLPRYTEWDVFLMLRSALPKEPFSLQKAAVAHRDVWLAVQGLFTQQGKLRPQLHGMFGEEVDQGDLLVIRKISCRADLDFQPKSSAHMMAAATNCVITVLSAHFRPGFLLTLPNTLDTRVPQAQPRLRPSMSCYPFMC